MSGLTGRLHIDLDAIAANWRALDAKTPPDCETGAVVKGDAYGCGIAKVAPTLRRAGARRFFVATPGEGATLRETLGPAAAIFILSGYAAEEEQRFRRADLRPCLNAPWQVEAWLSGPAGPAMLQLDSGMNRLGLEPQELAHHGVPACATHLMSHLACGDTPEHPQNRAQLESFVAMTQALPLPCSLAATAGILLGHDYAFDLVRPGVGLYGGAPYLDARKVVSLEIPILQIRDIAPSEAVGYGASWIAERPSRIATIACGYADGIIRQAGNATSGSRRPVAFIHSRPVPIVGRVSMDLITLDVTDCTEAAPGTMVELLGENQGVDDLAAFAGTIGYEILTSLGQRYTRVYESP